MGADGARKRKIAVIAALAAAVLLLALLELLVGSSGMSVRQCVSALFGSGDFFILRAHGYSMVEAGIEPGDMVVVKKQNTANEGDIVVALVGSDTTLKRYYTDKKRRCVRLHPENKEMTDILTKDCRIQGVAQHVIKAL